MKQLIRTILLVGALSVALGAGVLSSSVSADIQDACEDYSSDAKIACENGYNGAQCATFSGASISACEAGKDQATKDGTLPASGSNQNGATGGTGKCGGAKTEIVSCDEEAGLGAIASIIKTVLMIVTILIGTVATGGITYAAILYASARDNQKQVQDAIGIIRNVVIGLVLYGFTIAIINWLIPGGVIG